VPNGPASAAERLLFADLLLPQGENFGRKNPVPEPLMPKNCPEPPPFITGDSADEWWRTDPELHRLGLFTAAAGQVRRLARTLNI
jgi:hypothetical protein